MTFSSPTALRVAASVLRLSRRSGAMFTDVWAQGDRVSFVPDGDIVRRIVTVPARGGGVFRSCVGTKLLASVLYALRSRRVEILYAGALVVCSGRTRFVLRNAGAVGRFPDVPSGGVSVDREHFLAAFWRIVTAAETDSLEPAESTIRIVPVGRDLRLDFDAFEVSASDLIPGRAGVLGATPVSVSASALHGVLATFGPRQDDLRLTVGGPPPTVWFSARRPRSRTTVVAGTGLVPIAARDVAALLLRPYRRSIEVDARHLRDAMHRCAWAYVRGSVGEYLSIRAMPGDHPCVLLTQGTWVSCAERVPCRYDGPGVELTVKFHDLSAAIRRLQGPLTISFDDPARPILIRDRGDFRCALRPLPPAPPGAAPYLGFTENVPLPLISSPAAEVAE